MGFSVFKRTYVSSLILSAPIRLQFMSQGKRTLQNLAEVPASNQFPQNIFRLLIHACSTSSEVGWPNGVNGLAERFGHSSHLITGSEEVTLPCGHWLCQVGRDGPL